MSRILLVDDDDTFRPALQKTLQSLGHDVVPAADGRGAQTILLDRSTKFDLVISDIRMPEMDGIALTQFIKADDFSLPVILITGFAEILETQEAHRLGADEFITKPFEREEIAEAIRRCISESRPQENAVPESGYCRLGIEDFVSGRQIQFSIFIRLSETKFVKLAQRGEDLSPEQVRSYRSKGIKHLYLRREDFRKYLGFNLSLTQAIRHNHVIARPKKLHLLRHTGELLMEKIRHDGVDEKLFDSSATFVQATVDILADDPDVMGLLDALNQHTDHVYAHSVGVSLYSVMLAREVGWTLPTNRFKVAAGGLFHDVGQKEIDRELLMKPRGSWTLDEVKLYESHPRRGVEILSKIRTIPSDVLQIVQEHHEDCLARGFPARIKKTVIHPMAKLVAVANQFCNRIINSPSGKGVAPAEALQQMAVVCADRLEPQFFGALMRLFDFTPPENYKLRSRRSV